jgi:IS30 family transposase
VIERLGQDHSPQQISGWLRLQYPDNEQMQVSHEAIYRALYVQARGSLARELTSHLRTGRQKRYARTHSNRGQGPGTFPDMVMIAERPPEVEDRAVPGHWEGDLLMGNRDTAIATLVERQTRYCQLVALPQGTNAQPVCEAHDAARPAPPLTHLGPGKGDGAAPAVQR